MSGQPVFGGIEAGGTKFVCVIGTGPEDIRARTRFPTTEPEETLQRAVDFFREHAHGKLHALGIASFGPVELRRNHPDYGHITITPKPRWSGTDIVGYLRTALDVRIGFDTDVNGAALGEGRWGAARGLGTFVYMTVGTGLGVGSVVGGGTAHGLVHPEMGHVSVPRQPGDAFPGRCPFHGDCLEGMAAGPAIEERWGRRGEELTGGELDLAIDIEAGYLAAGLRNIVYTIAPERIVIGGGVAKMPGLIPRVRRRLIENLAGYPGLPEHSSDEFVVPAALGDMAGPVGALVLADLAAN
jgi:fructokinase